MKRFWRVLKRSLKNFYKNNSPDRAAVISYYSILAALPLVGVLLFFVSKIFSSEEIVFKSLHFFTKDLFSDVDPYFFEKASYLAKVFSKMGVYGIVAGTIIGFYVFSKTIDAINIVFKTQRPKHFIVNRVIDLSLMLVAGTLFISSFLLTNLFSAFWRFVQTSKLAQFINPIYIKILNNFFIRYFTPSFLTFLFFFIVYKVIPHARIPTRCAIFSAVLATLIWETAKGIFSWYFAKIAIYGKLHGTLAVIVSFVLLVDLGFSILLWGAEFTNALIEERKNEA